MVYQAKNKALFESCVFVKSFEGINLLKTKKEMPFTSSSSSSNENSCSESGLPSTCNTLSEGKSNLRFPQLTRRHFHNNTGETNLQVLLTGNRCFDGDISRRPEDLWEVCSSSKSSTTTSEMKNCVTDESQVSPEEDGLKSASVLETTAETEEERCGVVQFTASVLEGQKAGLNTKPVLVVKSKRESSLSAFSPSKRTLVTTRTESKSKPDKLVSEQQKVNDCSAAINVDMKTGIESRENKLLSSTTSLNTKLDSKAVFKLPRVDCYELTVENIIYSDTCTVLRPKKRRYKTRQGNLYSHISNGWDPQGEALKMRNSIYTKIAQQYVNFGEVSSVEGIRMNAVRDSDQQTLQALKAVEECNNDPPEIREVTPVKKFVIRLPPIS